MNVFNIRGRLELKYMGVNTCFDVSFSESRVSIFLKMVMLIYSGHVIYKHFPTPFCTLINVYSNQINKTV